MVRALGEIEAARAALDLLPIPPDRSLRLFHEARARSTRASTAIEGNPLDERGVRRAIAAGEREGGDAEQEVRNYWRALDRLDLLTAESGLLSEDAARELHAIVLTRLGGRRARKSECRTASVRVEDAASGRIEYMPPRTADVPALMRELFQWLRSAPAAELPAPVRAAILVHRFLSVHPFADGNGRTGRLLATAELWRSGYRMRGFLSFDEFFHADRRRYYEAIQMGLPIDFYEGRHDPEFTPWVEYFVQTIAAAAGRLRALAAALHGPVAAPWDRVSRRFQQVLSRLLARARVPGGRPEIDPRDVREWFGVSPNTARDWLREWHRAGLLEPAGGGTGRRIRRWRLGPEWREMIELAQRKGGDSTSILRAAARGRSSSKS